VAPLKVSGKVPLRAHFPFQRGAFVVARQIVFSLFKFIVVARQYRKEDHKSIHIVLAAIMNDDDEPLVSTPTSSPGEPSLAPMATADQGREMENIWQMMSMVTQTTGTNSQSLKNSGTNSWLGFGSLSCLWMIREP
jgi:hypothetical protein